MNVPPQDDSFQKTSKETPHTSVALQATRPNNANNANNNVEAVSSWVSDAINEHIQIYRGAVTLTITGLVVYALRRTPPFYRPTSISRIPSYDFYNRQKLRGRLISLRDSKLSDDSTNAPIAFHMVAQSPLERFPLFDVRGVFDIFRGREQPVVVELRNVSWPQDVGLRPLDDR